MDSIQWTIEADYFLVGVDGGQWTMGGGMLSCGYGLLARARVIGGTRVGCFCGICR